MWPNLQFPGKLHFLCCVSCSVTLHVLGLCCSIFFAVITCLTDFFKRICIPFYHNNILEGAILKHFRLSAYNLISYSRYMHLTRYYIYITWVSCINITRSRSSHRRCPVRKDVLRNFATFTGKHLCQSLFFNKVADWGLQLY